LWKTWQVGTSTLGRSSGYSVARGTGTTADHTAELLTLLTGEAGAARDAALHILLVLCVNGRVLVRPADMKHLCPVLKE